MFPKDLDRVRPIQQAVDQFGRIMFVLGGLGRLEQFFIRHDDISQTLEVFPGNDGKSGLAVRPCNDLVFHSRTLLLVHVATTADAFHRDNADFVFPREDHAIPANL